jgi:hypothetical protein
MDLAEKATDARLRGEIDKFNELSLNALKSESEAAWFLKDEVSYEPTRSILFRSAATLALDCNKTREAERLISAALAGNPPEEIANELRDLLENVYFNRHLEVKGIVLTPGELQMSIAGDSTAFGMARSDIFTQRLKNVEKLIYRTAERQQGKEFREKGRLPKYLTDNFELYLSVPRAASFAITLRLGQSDQMQFSDLSSPVNTVDDLLTNLEKFNEGDYKSLKERINDEDYYTNFIALAEKLSPDGKQIKTVGFTSCLKMGSERKVALTVNKSEIRKREQSAIIKNENIKVEEQEIIGTLLEADAKHNQKGIIQIVDQSKRQYKVNVKRGIMADIVKPLFEEDVVALVKYNGSSYDLISIDKDENSSSE